MKNYLIIIFEPVCLMWSVWHFRMTSLSEEYARPHTKFCQNLKTPRQNPKNPVREPQKKKKTFQNLILSPLVLMHFGLLCITFHLSARACGTYIVHHRAIQWYSAPAQWLLDQN